MYQDYFLNKKAIEDELIKHKFNKQQTLYLYETFIDKEFLIYIKVLSLYKTIIEVKDREFNDDYPLFFLDNNTSAHILELRKKAENILSKIRDECFEDCYFERRQPDEIVKELIYLYPDDFIERKNDLFYLKRNDNLKKYLCISKSSDNFYVSFSSYVLDIDDEYFFSSKIRYSKFNISILLNEKIPDKDLISFLMLSRELNFN